jgi:cell division protein FtsI (penicillin-binding protein 3)
MKKFAKGKDPEKWLKIRLGSLLLFFVILFVALISRAMQLQVLSGDALKTLAQKQHTRSIQLQPERGVIFDRNGEKLAVSIMADSVCADPSKIENPVALAAKLSPILMIDRATIAKKISDGKHFSWIARKISQDQANAIENLNLEGIFLIKEPKRFYPNGELGGSIIGFVGLDSKGLDGLELKYDRDLKGTSENLVWTRDAKGKRLYPRLDKTNTKKEDSHSLVLTIDSRIQYLVESKLKEAVRAKSAKGGYAIVMDPKTGEILALANEPSYNPNKSKDTPDKGKNRAIADCFDPGSTFKPFLVAAALDEAVINVNSRFNCENGQYTVADRVIHEANRQRHGTLAVKDIIKYSSNIGCVKISERLGKDKFHNYVTKFGFGSKTGIELPGESAGLLRPVKKWSKVDTATIAFGQGVSVTAVQLVTALSAIANKGVLMKPYIVKGLMDKNGNMVQAAAPTPVRRVISPDTARKLTSIMTGVVDDHDGTGKNARIVNVSVAGKTGTSQKFDFRKHVYSNERVRTSFMGFFPAEAPQVAILVILDEPQIDKWGGVAAAPVFKNIGEQILTCFKTNIRTKPLPLREDEKINHGMKVRLVSAQEDIMEENTSSTPDDEALMPNFRGLTVRAALKKATARGIELTISGSGWAIHQRPAPGVPIGASRSCVVSFSTGE